MTRPHRFANPLEYHKGAHRDRRIGQCIRARVLRGAPSPVIRCAYGWPPGVPSNRERIEAWRRRYQRVPVEQQVQQ